jgi:reactive intermediate/imine deaminase
MKTSKQNISTVSAPPPFGHYSQATTCNELIFVSGQLAANCDGSHGFNASFSSQVEQCLHNLMAIIEAAGGSKDSILKITAYLVGVDQWEEFNDVYAEFFGPFTPARAVVPVPALHNGYLIELDAIASIV